MALSDWTIVSGNWSVAVDNPPQGNANFHCDMTSNNVDQLLSRGSYTKVRLYLYSRFVINNTGTSIQGYTKIYHPSYGDLVLQSLASAIPADTGWELFRVSFWYDTPNNTKWGRVEKWVGGAWVQQSLTNCGLGTPTAGAISLVGWVNYSGGTNIFACFDDVFAYALS